MAITQGILTLEEFLKLPEADPALELIDGVVSQKVSPKGEHATLQPMLWDYFRRYAQPRGLAMAFTELRSNFADSSPYPTSPSTCGTGSRRCLGGGCPTSSTHHRRS